jgi:hypothetical protein
LENGTTFKRENGKQKLDISQLDEIPEDISDIMYSKWCQASSILGYSTKRT